MIQVYAPGALNQAADGAEAAEIVAVADPNPQAYIQLTQYAALAGQDRKADLAGQKAIELAPKKDQRSRSKRLSSRPSSRPPRRRPSPLNSLH